MYNANNIQALIGLPHVRKRLGPNFVFNYQVLHELIWHGIAEAVAACAQSGNYHISLTLHSDGMLSISHDGISDPSTEYCHGLTSSRLWDDDFFSNFFSHYRWMMGQSPIGIDLLRIKSRKLIIQTRYDGMLWQQIFEAGYPITDVRQISQLDSKYETGTTISFQPDFTIIEEHEVDFWDLLWQLQFLAGFIPDIELTLHDERSNAEIPNLIVVQPCDQLDAPAVHEPLVVRIPLNDGKRGEMDVELQYHHTRQPSINAYFNGLPELQLRPYLLCLLDDLRKYVNKFLYKYSNAPQNALTLSDICAGLSLDMYKRAASDSRHDEWPGNILQGKIHAYMDNLRMDNPTVFYRIIEKCLDNRQERITT